ncbi:hypothetical protein BCR42DRAFT_490044 [Absidia repens]|uniref:Uncharacterized protein n=1 Tax=Absidia repens TaxID=90262 RepID=A0A1X2ILT0_9FUNG|nr:hypothetical protein BCR42DRAFT_490044 [Absidia repens]
MTDNSSSSNQESSIPPRLNEQHSTRFSQQQNYAKNTTYRPPPQQQSGGYRPRYQQQQQQTERTGQNVFQQNRDYNGGSYRPRNPSNFPQRQSHQQRQPTVPHSQRWSGSTQQHNSTRNSQLTASKENSGIDDSDLVKSMQNLSTNDSPVRATATQDVMDDDDAVLECIATPLELEELQDIIEKYESMRGGCRIQTIDDTKALVVFGHPSTAKRAWTENRDNGKIKIQSYRGPIDIIEDIPIVRKSTMNQRPRPTNMVAKRLIHGSLGLKAPAKNGTQRKTDQDARDKQNSSTPKR